MQIHRFRVSELRSHPQQNQTYGDLSQHDFAALKEDIARRGVRHPIEVTRSGMIVDGHQRVRACRELRIEEIDAVICEDQSQQEIDESFVLANLVRRHLDPVAKAKALSTLMEIERHRRKSTEPDGEDLRDRLAKRLGGNISGRTVDRLLQLIRLPTPIHQAVSAGELPMTKALQIGKLSSKILADVADRITAGESARTVVESLLSRKKAGRHDTPRPCGHSSIKKEREKGGYRALNWTD